MAKANPDDIIRHSPNKLFEYVGKYEAFEKDMVDPHDEVT
jgi:hypothetical protein